MIPSNRPFFPPFRSSSYEAFELLGQGTIKRKPTYVTLNDDQTMHTTLLDELHQRAQGIRRCADHNTREVG